MKDAGYYAENPDQFEDLAEDQKEAIFNGETIDDGDTSSEESTEETVETTQDESSETPDATDAETETEILAKDGKHTIPYSELVDARNQADELKLKMAEQQKLIDELTEAKQTDEAEGNTEATDAFLENYEGDYPEVAEELKPMIEKLVQEKLSEFEQQVDEKVAPLKETTEQVEVAKHFEAISAEHPDYEKAVNSEQMVDWLKGQPSFAQQQYVHVLQQGSATQVNELLTSFKSATNYGVEDKDTESKAKQIIDNVKKPAPSSMSDIPASTAGTLDEGEAILEMSPRQLEEKFAGKSPEQVMELMNKLV